jgi:uncharacterized damage-inducible protein DinB
MIDVVYVAELYAYNRWANQKALDAASHLSEQERKRPMGSSFSSLHDTLVHMFGAEWIWLERWLGRSPRGLPTTAEVADWATLSSRWKQVEEGQQRFVYGLGAVDLERPITYVNSRDETWTYPLWQLLVHVANHSTYHRGQVTTLLRQLGAKPVMTDFLVYYDEKTPR